MPNHAGAPRRPRTAAGTTPPDIAHTLARVLSTSRRLLRALTCCTDVTSRHVAEALSTALRDSGTVDHRTVTLHTLAAVAAAHPCGAPTDLADHLADAWANTPTPAHLEAVVADGVTDGFDAELLCWDVIGMESLKHIGLIRKEASKLLRKLPERSTDELLGYGWAGLRVALRQYNPALGYSFSTYACPRINGAIRDGVRGENPLPKRLTTVVRAAVAAEEKLTHELQRTPTYAEVAAHLDAIEHAALLPRLAPAASIEELSTTWDSDKTRDPAFLIDPADPAEDAQRLLRVEAVRSAVAALPADEAAAVQLLCLEERTLADAAAHLGVEPRVLRASKRRAMTALAGKLEAHAAAL